MSKHTVRVPSQSIKGYRRTPRTCIVCGSEFYPTGIKQTACSGSCRVRAVAQARRQERKSLVPLTLNGATAIVPLTQGKFTLIDVADWPLVVERKWHAQRHGRTLYACSESCDGSDERGAISMHDLLMRPKPGRVVDHWDHDGLNNRRSNLRVCKQVQNTANRRKSDYRGGNATSRFKGVSWDKRIRRWRAGIKIEGQTHYLGSHRSEEDAARAYDAAALRHYGEFAKLNLPEASKPQTTPCPTQS
jgi:predicted nucleic acid-binding Zn ribbon protein